MRKPVTTTALGCLALATAADAQLAETRSTECAYGVADRYMVVEVATLDLDRWSAFTPA